MSAWVLAPGIIFFILLLQMKILKIVIIALILIVAVFGTYWFGPFNNRSGIRDFYGCVTAGYRATGNPPRCKAGVAGRTFTMNEGNSRDIKDLIIVDNPAPYQTLTSQFTISGRARGPWFFEAIFPWELLDVNNQTVASGIAVAQSDWQTNEFVPFSVGFTFSPPFYKYGRLVLRQANPSGLRENEKKLVIPVRF